MTYEEAIDKVILASSAWELEDDEAEALQMLINAGRKQMQKIQRLEMRLAERKNDGTNNDR